VSGAHAEGTSGAGALGADAPGADALQAALESRIRTSFDKQAFLQLLGASLGSVAPGRVEITLPFRNELVQQHGFLHAGVGASVTDSACGYAALTLMPDDAAVLSIEFKVNLLAPAKGARFIARGEVVRQGRNVSVVRGTFSAIAADGAETQLLELLGTMMTVQGRGLAD